VRASLWRPEVTAVYPAGQDIMARWFVPPIVVPAELAVLLVAVILYRQFIGV